METTAGVAVCITGELRTLLELPVVRTFTRRVSEPLVAHWKRADTHMAIVVPRVNHTMLRHSIDAAYLPRSLVILERTHTTAIFDRPPNPRCRVNKEPAMYNRRGDVSVLSQWIAIARCYQNAEKTERSDGQRYAWMMRVRTDLAYFEDVPLAAGPLDGAWAYVPSNGMTADSIFRCMNDQIFICPRALCRPYFTLTELWTSSFCRGTSQPDGSIFATDSHSPNGVNGPPDSSYYIPPPPSLAAPLGRMSAQWFLFARYSLRRGVPCCANETSAACCGLLREVSWPYSIAREVGADGRPTIECHARLASYAALNPRAKDFARRPSFWRNTSRLMRECEALKGEWAGSYRGRRGIYRRE